MSQLYFTFHPLPCLQSSGLISRVTDTVKSIVPSWLQKYFKNGDGPEEGGSIQGTEQNCQPPLPPNGREEGPPPLDGRDSPEPGTSFTGDASIASFITSMRNAQHCWAWFLFLIFLQSPQQVEHPSTFKITCFLDRLWVVPIFIFPRLIPPPQPLGLLAASSPSRPPHQLLDPFPLASPWSKKLRTTSRNTKMITSQPQAGSLPALLTKVRGNFFL